MLCLLRLLRKVKNPLSSSKIALLIDAENISYKDLPRILEEVSRQGEIISKTVYGDWKHPSLQNWHKLALKNGFEISHQAQNGAKNTSDMRLIMGAIDTLYLKDAEIFCLVTNDADYVPLCDRLHEAQKYVIGVGYLNASEALIRACNSFIFIRRDDLADVTPPALAKPAVSTKPVAVVAPTKPATAAKPAAPTAKKPKDFKKLLAEAFVNASPDTEGWVALSPLGEALRKIQPDFSAKLYGHATLTKLLQALPNDIELQKKGSVTSARLKPKAKPAAKPATSAKAQISQKLLTEAFAEAPQDDNQWVTLSALGSTLRKIQPGFSLKTYGKATLTKLLQAMPDYVELQMNGKAAQSARLKVKTNTPAKSVTPVKPVAPAKPITPAKPPDFPELLTEAFAKAPLDSDGWVSLFDLGEMLWQIQPDFSSQIYGHNTMTKLLQTMPDVVELQMNGKAAKSVRLKKTKA